MQYTVYKVGKYNRNRLILHLKFHLAIETIIIESVCKSIVSKSLVSCPGFKGRGGEEGVIRNSTFT